MGFLEIEKTDAVIVRPTLLLNEVIDDHVRLIQEVIFKPFSSIDTEVPTARFRGTMITRQGTTTKITGWQRNISRLQKMDVSLPTIISLELNEDYVIISANLHNAFQGSKGLLCNHSYLDQNLKKKLLNTIFDESFFTKVQVSVHHCFHIVEVLGGIMTCLDLMKEKKIDFIFEEEVLDPQVIGKKTIQYIGQQKFHFNENACNFALVLKGFLHKVRFNSKGGIYLFEPVDYKFFLNDELKFGNIMSAPTDKRLCHAIKVFCIEAVNLIRNFNVPGYSGIYLASNIYFQAFIGLVFQSISMKIYHNNLNYVLHTLNSIQRYDDIPQCVGAVDSQEEADKYFPGFDLTQIF